MYIPEVITMRLKKREIATCLVYASISSDAACEFLMDRGITITNEVANWVWANGSTAIDIVEKGLE